MINRANNICYNNPISQNKSDVEIFVGGAVSGITKNLFLFIVVVHE